MSTNQSRQAELAKLKEKEKKSQAFLRNMAFIMVLITIIYCVDEITSNINLMRPYMIFDLFKVPNADASTPEYANAISKMTVAALPTTLITVFLPLYKMLSDKYGRKLFLVINVLGMGAGMLVCMIAPNYIVYIIGTVIFGFFTPNDMQVIYVMEIAPAEKRATYCSVTKGIGLLSVSIIGVLRSIFYDPNDVTTWRLVFLVPVIIAMAVGIISAIFLKETPVFIQQKIERLENADAELREKAAEADEEVVKTSEGGLKEAFRFMKKDHQVRNLVIVDLIFMCAVALTGYAAETMLAYGQTDASMNTFYVVEPIVYAIFAFFSGFITDKMGRKNSGILFGIIALVGEVIFVLAAVAGANPIILALANGLMYGGLWSFSDLLYIVVPSESVPTEMRASIVGLLQYTAISNMVISALIGIFYQFIGSRRIGLLQLVFFVPFMLIAVLFVKKNLRETQNVDLNQAGRESL